MPPAPSTRPSIKLLKQTAYRGGVKDWSNRYHFNGGNLSGLTAFETLADLVAADEAPCFSARTTIIGAVYYDAGSEVPVHSKTLSVAGTLTATDGHPTPLETAALLRYSTDARTTKNHPIYLFNYFHDAYWHDAVSVEELSPIQRTAINEYGQDWLDGFNDGTVNHVRCGPYGAVAQGHTVAQYLSHRDFPR